MRRANLKDSRQDAPDNGAAFGAMAGIAVDDGMAINVKENDTALYRSRRRRSWFLIIAILLLIPAAIYVLCLKANQKSSTNTQGGGIMHSRRLTEMFPIISYGADPKTVQARTLAPLDAQYYAQHDQQLPPTPWICDGIRTKGRPLRIACLGDSITRGDGSHERPQAGKAIEDRGNYPAALRRLLTVRDASAKDFNNFFDVRNFGRGGATGCDESDTPYIKTKQFREAIKFQPDIVVIMLGTNDAKSQLWEEGGGDSGCGGKEPYLAGMQQLLKAVGADLGFGEAVEWKGEVVIGNDTTYRLPKPRSSPKVLIVPPPDVIKSKWGIKKYYIPHVRDSLSDLVVGRNESSTITSSCEEGDTGDSRTPVAVRLASELIIPPHPKLFAEDQVHLSIEGSGVLACSVFLELMDWCGAMDGILESNSSRDFGGDNGGLTKSPRRDSCAGAVDHELLSGWEKSVGLCRKVLRDPVMNTPRNKPF